jgi:hypothetical protein
LEVASLATPGVLDFTRCVNEALRETCLPEKLDALFPYTVLGTKPNASAVTMSSSRDNANKLRIRGRVDAAPFDLLSLLGPALKRIEIV